MTSAVVRLIAAVGLIALFAVPVRAEWTDARRAEFVTSFIAGHVVPRYAALASGATDMHTAAEAFCASPSEDRLAAARAAFSKAYLAWMGVQHIRFGPAMRDDAHYRLQFWPDKHGQGAKQIRRLMLADTPVPTTQELARASVALQGFPALERLMFGDAAALLSGDAKAARRCALLGSIGANVVRVSQDVRKGWTAYRADDPDTTMREIVRVYLEQLQTVTELKLKRPLGKSIEAARPKRSEAWRSGLSFAAISANLNALQAIYAGEHGWTGFKEFLARDDETQSMATAIEEHFGYGTKVIAGQASSLPDTVRSEKGRRVLRALIGTVDEIREFSFTILPEGLGVTLGFNSLDGD